MRRHARDGAIARRDASASTSGVTEEDEVVSFVDARATSSRDRDRATDDVKRDASVRRGADARDIARRASRGVDKVNEGTKFFFLFTSILVQRRNGRDETKRNDHDVSIGLLL